jgi:hypothetical protein
VANIGPTISVQAGWGGGGGIVGIATAASIALQERITFEGEVPH